LLDSILVVVVVAIVVVSIRPARCCPQRKRTAAMALQATVPSLSLIECHDRELLFHLHPFCLGSNFESMNYCPCSYGHYYFSPLPVFACLCDASVSVRLFHARCHLLPLPGLTVVADCHWS